MSTIILDIKTGLFSRLARFVSPAFKVLVIGLIIVWVLIPDKTLGDFWGFLFELGFLVVGVCYCGKVLYYSPDFLDREKLRGLEYKEWLQDLFGAVTPGFLAAISAAVILIIRILSGSWHSWIYLFQIVMMILCASLWGIVSLIPVPHDDEPE